ncbi:MAG: hypothetical protein ACLR43_10975 [Faecalibacillus faecis]
MNQFVGKEYQVLYVTGKPYYESMKDYENENVKSSLMLMICLL